MRNSKISKEEVLSFLETCELTSTIYIGTDSERFKLDGKWYADYTTVLVVHINGNKGCRIFAQVEREADFDQHASKPFNRMMGEVYRSAALYQKFKDLLYDYEIEIHCDISRLEDAGSNVAAKAAIGYIQGTCNVIPFLKPESFAASYGADRAKKLFKLEAMSST